MRTPINLTRLHICSSVIAGATIMLASPSAHAVRSGELFRTSAYQYGRFEARVRFAAGDGVVSSFFLWKNRSETATVFWNELDFEKVRADCELETNALYGLPEATHSETYEGMEELCGAYHTYMYEWTPDYIAWSIDDVEIRRETGETAAAYAENTESGMQFRFNIWPGDASFGGHFDPAILPVHQYINWVQYSSYAEGTFEVEWREDFTGASRPSGWSTGSWPSPKNLSTHAHTNVNFVDGYAVLSLTADDATGFSGTVPIDPDFPEPELPDPAPEDTDASDPSSTTGMPSGPDPSATAAPPENPREGPPGGCSVVAPEVSEAPWRTLVIALFSLVARRRRSTR